MAGERAHAPGVPVIDDEPSVLGGGCGIAPMPTEADFKAAYRRAWIARFAYYGVPEWIAVSEIDGANWDDIKIEKPEDAANAAMEVWDAD